MSHERIGFDKVRALCDGEGKRNLQSVDQLTMGDYEQVLKNKEVWELLDWKVDRVALTDHISELRRVRNDIAHFKPDSNPRDAVPRLRNMLDLLRSYDEADRASG